MAAVDGSLGYGGGGSGGKAFRKERANAHGEKE